MLLLDSHIEIPIKCPIGAVCLSLSFYNTAVTVHSNFLTVYHWTKGESGTIHVHVCHRHADQGLIQYWIKMKTSHTDNHDAYI